MLSESDKQFIDNNRNLTVEELAAKTSRPVKDITAYVKQNKRSNLSKVVTNGVAIMTPGVSQQLDETGKASPDDKPYIRKIRE